MDSYIRTVVADPECNIEDKSVVWSNDSICIIRCKIRARNKFGGWVLDDYEYATIKESNDNTYEVLIDKYRLVSVFIDFWKKCYDNDATEVSNAIYVNVKKEVDSHGHKVE